MKTYVYCRSSPNDMKVARNDRIKAQKRRCLEFAKSHDLLVTNQYADQGSVHPIDLTFNLWEMLRKLEREDQKVIVLVDHHYRLGASPETVARVIKEIESRNAFFLPILTKRQIYLKQFYREIYSRRPTL